MRVTREAAEPAILGLSLVVFAMVLGSPIPLVGTALIGAWLLARQHAFVRRVISLADGIAVEQSLSRSLVAKGESSTLALDVWAPGNRSVDVTVSPNLPVASRVRGDDPAVTLEDWGTRQHAIEVVWPVAGELAIEAPTVACRDPAGWFDAAFRTGDPVTILVEPLRPETLHVGEGGDRVPGAYGDHAAGEFGTGMTPGDIREYVAGDPADRIDWKVSARFNDLYIREIEPETDLETVVVFDHSHRMDVGTGAGTKLDYLREIALAYLDHADAHGDPVGLLAIGDEGVTTRTDPEAGSDHRARVQSAVLRLRPTGGASPGAEQDPWTGPELGRRIGTRLTGQAAFDRTLQPFFRTGHGYVARIADRPLFVATRGYARTLPENRLMVVLTDDESRAEVREAVRLARGDRGRVVVFLTPTCLFRGGAVRDAEAIHREYVSFERFRRELDSIDRVVAFEVAPGDRIAAVIEGARDRRATA